MYHIGEWYCDPELMDWNQNAMTTTRKVMLSKKYDMSLEEYNRMLAKQGGVCAICQKPPSEKRQLAVDHCHRTQGVRGLLCTKCNLGLGCFDDAEDLLQQAVTYLRFRSFAPTPVRLKPNPFKKPKR